jgi:hypothetical protein
MGWISRFLASREAKRADPRNETVINGELSNTCNAIEGNPDNPAFQGDGTDVQIAEEIKQRQIALAVRYVTSVRAR